MENSDNMNKNSTSELNDSFVNNLIVDLPEQTDFNSLFFWRINCLDFFSTYDYIYNEYMNKIKNNLFEIIDIGINENFDIYLFDLINNISNSNNRICIPFKNKKRSNLILDPNPNNYTVFYSEDIWCIKHIFSNSYNSVNIYTLFLILYFTFNPYFKDIDVYKNNVNKFLDYFDENFQFSRSRIIEKKKRKEHPVKMFIKLKEYKQLLENIYFHPDNIDNLINSNIFKSPLANIKLL